MRARQILSRVVSTLCETVSVVLFHRSPLPLACHTGRWRPRASDSSLQAASPAPSCRWYSLGIRYSVFTRFGGKNQNKFPDFVLNPGHSGSYKVRAAADTS